MCHHPCPLLFSLRVACTRPCLSPPRWLRVGKGNSGRKDIPPKFGPPKDESVLGGLGSFVAGNHQLPPLGSEKLGGQKGLGKSINDVSVEAEFGRELGTEKAVQELASKPPLTGQKRMEQTREDSRWKWAVSQSDHPVKDREIWNFQREKRAIFGPATNPTAVNSSKLEIGLEGYLLLGVRSGRLRMDPQAAPNVKV